MNIIRKMLNLRNRNADCDKRNVIIDAAVRTLSLGDAGKVCKAATIDRSGKDFHEWLSDSNLHFTGLDYYHKKALEFFFSFMTLELTSDDILLDAAGGRSGYLDAARKIKGCTELYLTDHIYTGITETSDGIKIAGGDIGNIPLPDASLTKIACHHAFEHFQGDKDVAFINEVGRLLRHGGRACIIPLFLVDRYTECWNVDRTTVFDSSAQLVIDKSATIPGADEDGHFARFYDLDAFDRRIVRPAKAAGLIPSIFTCRLDGSDLPEMEKNFGSKLNYPLRALILNRL